MNLIINFAQQWLFSKPSVYYSIASMWEGYEGHLLRLEECWEAKRVQGGRAVVVIRGQREGDKCSNELMSRQLNKDNNGDELVSCDVQ